MMTMRRGELLAKGIVSSHSLQQCALYSAFLLLDYMLSSAKCKRCAFQPPADHRDGGPRGGGRDGGRGDGGPRGGNRDMNNRDNYPPDDYRENYGENNGPPPRGGEDMKKIPSIFDIKTFAPGSQPPPANRPQGPPPPGGPGSVLQFN